MNEGYKRQAQLLLDVLPEVARESCFALHGGTAINLFVRDMPRLSVDIDLTYVPIEERTLSLDNINGALARIAGRISELNPAIKATHRQETCKLLISTAGAQIKIEVNVVSRGALSAPVKTVLCKSAQQLFEVFCAIDIVPLGQLYGGKLCAALDRQHPRDLFDVHLLLMNEGITEDIKRGFIYSLISSDRPMHEILNPNFQDQRQNFEANFSGMTRDAFTYDDYEETRQKIVSVIKKSLTEDDREFLLGFIRLEPDWSDYSFEAFPAVQWKLQNLATLRLTNAEKFQQQLTALAEVLQVGN